MTVPELNKKDNRKCTACGSCLNACPVGAIEFNYSYDELFFYPNVNQKKCIRCGKCEKACPIDRINDTKVQLETPLVYAAAADDSLRRRSSSGAVFALLAKHIIRAGGVVFGARFDEKWHLILKSAETIEDCEPFKQSKYVGCVPNMVYVEVEKYLKNNRKVLFTGTPCQVEGLYTYLGKDYDNLYSMDFICHGVPSPKIFNKYLEEISNGRTITNISFRNKKYGWDNHNLFLDIDFNKGDKHLIGGSKDPYFDAFLKSLFNRESCGTCQYARADRTSDITVGDCWGINKFEPEIYDGKGLSWVTVNSCKGEELFSEIEKDLKIEREYRLEDIVRRNMCFSTPKELPAERDRALNMIRQGYSVKTAAEYSLLHKYDVVLCENLYGRNYGSLLSAWCLYKAINNMGYNVLVAPIADGKGSEDSIPNKFVSARYAKSDVCCEIDTMDHLLNLNRYSSFFILGSEQYWKGLYDNPINGKLLLDFVFDSNYRLSYAVSLNEEYYGQKVTDYGEKRFWLNKFDEITVREEKTVVELEQVFGVKPRVMPDPVLLIGEKEIIKGLGLSDNNGNEDYICAYFLEPNLIKDEALKEWMQCRQCDEKKCITYGEGNPVRMQGSQFDFLGECELEEWVEIIRHSESVITDSYHGVCLSLLFNKEFVVVPHENRGVGKVLYLLEHLGIQNRIYDYRIESWDTFKNSLNEIKWNEVNEKLNEERLNAFEFLSNIIMTSLNNPKPMTEFDILRKSMGYNSQGNKFALNKTDVTDRRLLTKWKKWMSFFAKQIKGIMDKLS